MAVGDVERMVEGLVNRGLIAPAMVGRTVGQATIDELQNLGNNLQTSQAIRKQTNEQRLNLLQRQDLQAQSAAEKQLQQKQMNVMKQLEQLQTSVKPISRFQQPFAVGYTKDEGVNRGQLAIATPTARGFALESQSLDPATNALSKLALENSGLNVTDLTGLQNLLNLGRLPTINTNYIAKKNIQSLPELLSEVARQSSDMEAIKRLFGGE